MPNETAGMTYKYNPFSAAYPSDRGPLGKIFRPVLDQRTYLRTGHMILMFPLGIAYFVFLIVTFSVGGSMIWTLVGPIVLLATLFVSRWLGDLEAFTAGYVNGSTIRRPPFRLEGVSGFRSQVKIRLVDPTTWTGLIYLAVQFPVGITAFVGLVTVYAFVGALIFAPLGVLFNDNFIDVTLPWGVELVFDTVASSLVLVPFGLLGFVLASHLVLAFSSLHGWWARLMLGSRSTRVSSRPAPAPTGDEPPRPSTVAEPLGRRSDAIALEGSGSNSEATESGAAGAGTTSDSNIDSPRTAAHAPSTPTASVPTSPFLKPVPDLSELPVAVRIPDLTPIAELTAREQEVFMLMAHGDTNADIAEELFISEGTVKTHVKRILSKLSMRDRTQVVVFAYEERLVVPGATDIMDESFEARSYGG